MTKSALNNTLRDLLGVVGEPADVVELDESIGPFFSNAIAPVTDLIVEQYGEMASRLAVEVGPRANEIAGCDLGAAAPAGTACIDQLINGFGARAYRRPLAADEVAAYRDLFALGAQEGGAQRGAQLVFEVMLQSPFFLYHVDTGPTGTISTVPQEVTGYELASRLSYFLWNSMPDDRLFELAGSGALADPVMVEQEVDRMLADPKAADAIPSFHLQWLGIRDMQGVTREVELFPQFGEPLRAAMIAETANFSDYVVRQGDGTIQTLLSADFSLLDGSLFDVYGVTPPPGYVPGQPVPLDPTQRAGLLTQAAFLTRHAHPDQTSPVHRGLLVRENLLCQTIPSPPPDVDNVAPAVTESETTRERFARHEEDPVCASCHLLIDPIGLGFEHYDSVGAWRDFDGPFPVDATGELTSAGADVDGAFDGAVELAQRLARSQTVRECTARQWFRFALGRIESPDDACTLQGLYMDFDASDGNIRQLLASIATSDAFRYVRAGDVQ